MEQDRGDPPQKKKERGKSLGQRWAAAQPTKTVLFWSCIITAIVTMLVGFTWGGWVTGRTAQSMSEKMSREAVVVRLAPICVAQFSQGQGNAEKLEELKAMKSDYTRTEHIIKQGWATISGEEKPDRKVAAECAKLLMQVPETTSALSSE